MESLEKTIKYVKLFNLYSQLLTHTQQEIAADYFLADLSLSEIADNRNISRSAVEDAVKKSMQKLDDFESKMHLLEKRDSALKITVKLKKQALNNSEIIDIEELEKDI